MNEGLRSLLKELFAGTFGSQAGNFGYPISQRVSVSMVVIGIAVALVLVSAVRLTVPRLRTHEWQAVVLWLAIGFAAQLALHSLALYPFGRIVESVNATAFYTVSQQYSASELLSRHHELVGTLPTHARANLPGKTLLFELLGLFTANLQGLGYLIILLSNLGGVVFYLFVKGWSKDQLTAFYALVLYLLVPARIYFFPLLNTISPCFMLLVFWFVTRYLTSRRRTDLALAGVSLYALILFDPLTLAAMPIVAALVVKQLAEGALTWTRTLSMVAWITAAFVVVDLLMRAVFGFDLISALLFAIEDARGFNVRTNRPYSVWVVHNLKDFFLNMGLAQSAVFVGCVAWAVSRVIAEGRNAFRSVDVVMTLAFLFTLTVLDVSGVNRGETVRLWIFLGVLMQMLVARACATSPNRRLFEWVSGISILQTAVCARIVLWIVLEY